MTADRRNEPEEWEHLNFEAFLALGLARASIIDPIVTLLRSDAPINPIVRNAIADAFEGKRPGGAPQFVVKGTGRGAHIGLSHNHFRRDVAIARYVSELRAGGARAGDAIRKASDKFRMSEKTCEAAVTKTAKMDEWINANPMAEERDSGFAHFSDEQWQHFREENYWANFLCRDALE